MFRLVPPSDLDLVSRSFDLDFGVRNGIRVTLVAVTVQPDYILIGSDSQLTEAPEGLRSTIKKLQRHNSAPLAWGTSGNPALGIDRFTDWLKSCPWPPKSKAAFQDSVAKKVAEINGKQREHCKSAGVDPTEEELFSVLVTAWIDDEAFVLAVDNRGVIASIEALSFHAIGSGRIFAKVVNTTINSLTTSPFSNWVERFRFTVTLVASIAPACSSPTAIWKLERSGITELSGK